MRIFETAETTRISLGLRLEQQQKASQRQAEMLGQMFSRQVSLAREETFHPLLRDLRDQS